MSDLDPVEGNLNGTAIALGVLIVAFLVVVWIICATVPPSAPL